MYIVEGIHATILPIIPDNCPRSWCFLQTFPWYNRGQSTRRLVIYRDPLKWKAKGLVNTVKDTYPASLHHAIEYTWLLINYWHVNPLTGALWLAERQHFCPEVASEAGFARIIMLLPPTKCLSMSITGLCSKNSTLYTIILFFFFLNIMNGKVAVFFLHE